MFIREFEQRLKDTFMQSCFSDMESSNKCFLYRSLCREFSMASYLYKIHIPANRKAMTRLRFLINQYNYYYMLVIMCTD